MKSLKHLVLKGNLVSNLMPLLGLEQLEHLDLADNQIGNLAPIEQLTRLNTLDLRDNPQLSHSEIIKVKKALPRKWLGLKAECSIHHNAE